MKILIPNNNIAERKYIIDILLGEFLGLEYKIEIKDTKNYEIILKNGNKLIIEDHFFNKCPKDLEYLNEKNIPQKVEFGNNDFIVEENIPIIYGTNKLITNHQSPITITCGIDIFASSFFMLTRWEEYVNKTRDIHNRFPAYASLAYKNNFLDRPVVNEYVEMLWNMLKFLGIKQERKKREFEFVLTHDVDTALLDLKTLLLNPVKNKNIWLFLKYIKRFGKNYDTYDYLMDISEKIGTKSYFFLHSSNANKRYDECNDMNLKKVTEKILKRGHFIGYHPSYNAFDNLKIFLEDKKRIEKLLETELKFGRMHYLKFLAPFTWRIWEEANMEWDSTLGYPEKEGFRCGICYEFSVFDFLKRKKYRLKEKPLLAMDATFLSYEKITPIQMKHTICELLKKVKKYQGEFVILWHNSSCDGIWKEYKEVYEKVLNEN